MYILYFSDENIDTSTQTTYHTVTQRITPQIKRELPAQPTKGKGNFLTVLEKQQTDVPFPLRFNL